MSGPTLVTGACGFIGGHLVRQLLDAGHSVRALVRHPEQLAPDLGARLDLVRGDVRDVAAVGVAVAGAEVVLHLAACASAWRRDPREFWRVNVQGTGRVLRAAARHGVRRFVHVSTILALPPHRSARVGGAAARLTPYEETKMAAERLVQEAAARGLHAVTVRPTRVYGPGPRTEANAVTRLIALYLAGRFRVRLADGGALANYVHAADVATAIRLAASRGPRGARYVIGGLENVSLSALLALVGEISGVRRGTVALPARLGLAIGRAAEWWGALGGRPLLTAGWVRTFLEDRRADVWPAHHDLGYAPRSLREGLAETIAWIGEGRTA